MKISSTNILSNRNSISKTHWQNIFLPFIYVSAALAILSSCNVKNAAPEEGNSEVAGVAPINPQISPIADAELARYKFALFTPTGKKIFQYAAGWEKAQLTGINKKYFPQRAMCATNVTEVFEEVYGKKYNDAGVGNMLSKIRKAGSQYELRFKGDSGASIAKKLNSFFAGLPVFHPLKGKGIIPLGTVLAGCTAGRNCFGGGPDEHVGFIGHTKIFPKNEAGITDVIYYVWNNNWLRNLSTEQRNRDLGFGLGILNKYAIPANYAELGYERRWMAVPWLKVSYDARGVAQTVVRILPELDDLDLGNSGFDTYLVLPRELSEEINNGQFATGI